MWWLDTPDSRLAVAKSRGDELRAEAASNRLVNANKMPGEVRLAVSGRHFHVGSLVIVFGRTLREEDCRGAQSARA